MEINLNDCIKVKLTPLGAEIFYHRYDKIRNEVPKQAAEVFAPRMPQINKDGFTKFTIWELMELYGEHIGVCKPNVFIDNTIYLTED